MDQIQKIKASANYLPLKESVQYRFDRTRFLIMAFSFGFTLLLFLVTLPYDIDYAFTLGLVSLGLLAVALHHARWWLGIFRHIDGYIFREVLLEHPRLAPRSGMYFTVCFHNSHGELIQRDTSSMFFSTEEPNWKEYNNQTVLIGYNEETDRVVVIKRIDP